MLLIWAATQVGGGAAPIARRSSAPAVVTFDAVRTWYNYPVVLNDAGNLYAGSVSANGSVQVNKTNAIDTSAFTLAAALEVDDHDDATLLKLPSGKLSCFYSKHSTDGLIRYRLATNALPDIAAFAAEKSFNDGQVSYAAPFLLSDNNVRVYYRKINGATLPRKMAKTPVADLEAGTEIWTLSTIFETTGQRPYLTACQNGVDRIDFAMTNGHPNEVATSLYHCYMQLDAGVEKYYTSAGVEIFAPIDVTATATLVDDTTGGRVWNDKIAIGPDGFPRILFTKYPTGTTGANGGAGTTYTNIEYWHARWDGTAWVKTRLLTGQRSLYPNEAFYTGSMCFDGNDVTIVYLAEISGSIYEMKKYQIDEAAGTKTLLTSYTTNSLTHNFRPQSPSGSDRPYEVTWLDGTYTSYTSYATRMKGGGAVVPTVGTFTPADMFLAAEKGAWWDPSDFSTMFQDTAATVPVTATGQTVARINDKSGNAKHLLQATAGSRPTLQQDGAGKYYLDFDGIADFMSVANFDLSTTDAATAIAGVRKSTDAAMGVIFELSASSTFTNGTIAMFSALSAGANFGFRHKGTAGADSTTSGNPAPMLAVVAGTGKIATDLNQCRVNGGLAARNTLDQGTGNLRNDTLYVGMRGGSTLPFAGRLYGLIIRGATTTNATLATAEAWMNEKTGAY